MTNINRDDYYITQFDRYVFAVEKRIDDDTGSYEPINWKQALYEFTELMELMIKQQERKKEAKEK